MIATISKKARAAVAILSASAIAAGCLLGVPALKNAPVDGSWSLTVKNEADGCMFDGWMPGSVNTIELNVEQFGDDKGDINAQLGGLLGFVLWAGLGTSTLTGSITGEDLDLTLLGTKDEILRGCTFRREIRVTAQAKSDRLRDGRITHVLGDLRGDACAALKTCRAIQTFDGTRIDVADAAVP